jgi:3',5'-cyclic AMP phosphodiesterase CpdA
MNNYLNELYQSIRTTYNNRKKLKIAHIADPHIDGLYAIGSDQNCHGYLCCRAENGFPTEPERQAGEWGAYMCDMPLQTLRLMAEYIRDTVKPDILVWTGDNTAHAIWDSNPKEVLESTTNITNMLNDVFKNTKVTIVPINGNHDVFPAND